MAVPLPCAYFTGLCVHVFDAKKETEAQARLRVCWPAAQIIGARSSQLPSILAALASNLPRTG